MSVLSRLSNIVGYIEEHLQGEIDIRTLAKMACCSEYNFQRLFSAIADISLGEYIRRRRLSIAAVSLLNSETKLIDIALQSGYQSSDAFSRAFFRCFGVKPIDVRLEKKMIQPYPKLSLDSALRDKEKPDWRIENKGEFFLVGRKRRVCLINWENFKTVPEFWDELSQKDFIRLVLLCNVKPKTLLGVSCNYEADWFDYMIAAATTKTPPEGYEYISVPAGEWVVFECRGILFDKLKQMRRYIYAEWFPSSEYDFAMPLDFEWYYDDDLFEVNNKAEIWMPVIKKKDMPIVESIGV